MARILIIDDDKEMSSLLLDFLEGEGYEATSANDGGAGLRRIAGEKFDLVLTDFRMPGLTGLDILPEIRKLQPATSVVVITAFGSEEVCHRAMERGASAYVEKPVSFHILKNLIDEMLSSKREKGERIRNVNEGAHKLQEAGGDAEIAGRKWKQDENHVN